MARSKKTPKFMNMFEILINSFGLYFKNLPILSRVMYFPVFGQLAGLVLIFATTMLYAQNMQNLIRANSFFNNALVIFIGLLILAIPGFILFLKAFWEYLIATVSLNSIILSIDTKGDVNDIKTHILLTKDRSRDYVALLAYLAVIWILAVSLPFVAFVFAVPKLLQSTIFTSFISINLFICSVLSIYLSLSYQVFAFNEHLGAFEILKKSIATVKGNFGRIVGLAVLTTIISGIIYPSLLNYIFDMLKVTNFAAIPVERFIHSLFPNPKIFESLVLLKIYSYKDLSLLITSMIIGSVITAMMLPWNSACYTLMYFDIEKRRNAKMIKDSKK